MCVHVTVCECVRGACVWGMCVCMCVTVCVCVIVCVHN